MALVPLEQARALVLSRCPPVHPAAVPLADALGLVAASSVHAEEAVPAFDNTAMDGYAVRAVDTAGAPVVLRVVGVVAAGSAPAVEVGAGEAVRIMTGAPMPGGADAVVMVESTAASADGATVE
ncbi:MAG: molybdenum cofactor synthesis protein, partial [Actinomycetota bacterium]|nr:molybdenum cofactor synthesis protein [Actinomycetota bacterium]